MILKNKIQKDLINFFFFVIFVTVTGCSAPSYNQFKISGNRQSLREKPVISFPEQNNISVKILEPDLPQKTEKINLNSAFDLAFKNNTELALSRAEEYITKWKYNSSLAGFLPSLEFRGSAATTDGWVQGSFGKLADVDYNTYDPRLSLVFRLNPGKQLFNIFAIRKELDAALYAKLSTEQRLLFRVTELYENLILTYIGVQVSEQLVNDSKKFVRITQAKEATGVGSGADVERAKAKMARDEQQLITAIKIWQETSVALATVIRLETNLLLKPSSVELVPWGLLFPENSSNLKEIVKQNPEVNAANQIYSAQSHLLTSKWWELLFPEITAAISKTQIGDEPNDLNSRSNRSVFFSWTFSFDKIAQIGHYKGLKKAAQLQAIETEDKTIAELKMANQELQAFAKIIPFAKKEQESAETNLRIVFARFKAGTAIALEVLDAEDTLARARLNLARSIVAFNLAQVKKLAAIGTLNPNIFQN